MKFHPTKTNIKTLKKAGQNGLKRKKTVREIVRAPSSVLTEDERYSE